MRYAQVKITGERDIATIARYLPSNYEVVENFYDPAVGSVLIAGTDDAGWTLDGYVIPRLASGLWFAAEVVL